jgi:hypothetical protein
MLILPILDKPSETMYPLARSKNATTHKYQHYIEVVVGNMDDFANLGSTSTNSR